MPDVAALAERLRAACARTSGRIAVMEVCGTHTVSLFRAGVRSMLPPNLKLVSGPGCPVCVTPQPYVDAACELAARPGVTVATYGDMVRVPGRGGSLAERRSEGARVRVVYSVRHALKYALENPDEEVCFLAVGFETTAPATAAAALEAEAAGAENFSLLMGHKTVLPAMAALLEAEDVAIDGFLCPGHVSVVLGARAYAPLAARYRKPCVVAGFEPAQMLAGLERLAAQVVDGRAEVENVYGAVVDDAGNPHAQALIERVFEPEDAVWRAMGTIPGSGLALRAPWRRFDAARKFGVVFEEDYEPEGCRCGAVIQGKAEPADCPLFGAACTPMRPVGPCMVSGEGTCAAWYKYGARRPA